MLRLSRSRFSIGDAVNTEETCRWEIFYTEELVPLRRFDLMSLSSRKQISVMVLLEALQKEELYDRCFPMKYYAY